MFDFLKYIPMVMQLLDLKDKVKEKLRTGASVKTFLEEVGPGALDLIKQVGNTFFPNVAGEEKQVQAAAMKVWDLDYVRGVQTALNKLGASPALAPDGDYGEKTKAAVTAFQTKFKVELQAKFKGDPVDGWAGPMTWAVLQSEVKKLGT